MQRHHVVWDWNGTLLDDLEIVIEATNVGISAYGVAPMDENVYRDHFTRPVRAFYDSLFGRPISDMEWAHLNKSFHDEYRARIERAALTPDAIPAIDEVVALGWTQSLLSMSVQTWLNEAVEARGLTERFDLVDGLTGATGGLKTAHLAAHIARLRLDSSRVFVIGDTPDDVAAARQSGAVAILYDGGSHHLPTLEAQGAPVAHSLEHAVALAASLTGSADARSTG
jgi:phosphoglycolate phosphatase-like HAD superfamily hydrolase